MAILDRKLWDVYVAPTGGDYSSIATALALGTDLRIYVDKGTYSETASCAVLANQRVYFDDVTINLGSGFYFGFTGNDSTITGKVAVSGVGDAGHNTVFYGAGDRVNATGCDILVTATNLTPANDIYTVFLNGMDNSFLNVRTATYTYTGTSGAAADLAMLVNACTQNYFNLTVGARNNDDGSSPAAVRGIELQGNSSLNSFEVVVNGCTTTSGNGGTGVLINAGSNYNSFIGASRGSDLANLTDSGTGNKTGNLAV